MRDGLTQEEEEEEEEEEEKGVLKNVFLENVLFLFFWGVCFGYVRAILLSHILEPVFVYNHTNFHLSNLPQFTIICFFLTPTNIQYTSSHRKKKKKLPQIFSLIFCLSVKSELFHFHTF